MYFRIYNYNTSINKRQLKITILFDSFPLKSCPFSNYHIFRRTFFPECDKPPKKGLATKSNKSLFYASNVLLFDSDYFTRPINDTAKFDNIGIAQSH